MIQRPVQLEVGDALILVDVQNDFLPGGSLPVPRGNEIIERLNRAIQAFEEAGLPIFATRDWHPVRHCSFREQGGPWPPHCIAGTYGAEFPKDLQLSKDVCTISKATSPDKDAYSGFEDTKLESELKAKGALRLFVGGLATEYCVLNTVRDARKHGFQVYFLRDAIRAIHANTTLESKALAEMAALGAHSIQTTKLQVADLKRAA